MDAFNQTFNDLVDAVLETSSEDNRVVVQFEIPDLQVDNQAFDPRDQRIAVALTEASSVTAFAVLEYDQGKGTNLTLRTAEDVYRKNADHYTSGDQNITSGRDLVHYANANPPVTDPADLAFHSSDEFWSTLKNQVNDHFLGQKSWVYVVAPENTGIAGSKLQDVAIEHRSQTLAEVAETLNSHENSDQVMQGIFGADSIVPEIGASPNALTSHDERRDTLLLDGDLSPEQQQARLEQAQGAVLDMSNYFGVTGADMLVTGLLNNPELLNVPFAEAWNKLNPSVEAGNDGRIARAYLVADTG